MWRPGRGCCSEGGVMNGRKARRLRKQAAYDCDPEQGLMVRTVDRVVKDKDAKPITIQRGILFNHPHSYRGMYRKLKKAA